ncbi:hypothetical protein CPB85DRAFT_1335807 [Mucidula mucida]|nr:hypothetical protein CPB85DRAFT_1335807 [Mucidula mucida]
MPRNCDIDSSHTDSQIQLASVRSRRHSLQHYLEAYLDEEDVQDEPFSDGLPNSRIDNLVLNAPPPVNVDARASACSTTFSPGSLIMSPSPTKVPIIASSGSKMDVRADAFPSASPSTPNGSSRRPKTPGIKWPLALYVRPPFSPKSPSEPCLYSFVQL